MHKVIATSLLMLVVVAGCASAPQSRGPGLGGDPLEDTQGLGAGAGSGTNSGAEGATPSPAAVDCGSITQQHLQAFSYGVQTLAQLDSQEAVDAVRQKRNNFDPEVFAAAIAALHALDGHAVSPYGDPALALAYYSDANAEAMNLLAYNTPIPAAEFTAFTKVTGGVSEVIAQQSPISASYNQNCAN